MKETVQVNYVYQYDPIPVYNHYPVMAQAQPAFVELTDKGELRVDWLSDIDNASSFSEQVLNNQVFRWEIPNDLSGEGVNALMNDIKGFANKLHSGLTVEWDGQKMVRRLNDDAKNAFEQIKIICNKTMEGNREYDRSNIQDAVDWIAGDFNNVVKEYKEIEDFDKKQEYMQDLVETAKQQGIVLAHIEELEEQIKRNIFNSTED